MVTQNDHIMKKLRENINSFFERLDERWRSLPSGKQRRYTIYLFLGYLSLTIGAIINAWYDGSKTRDEMAIEHIENPVLKSQDPARSQDSLSTIFKYKIYERK